MQTSLFLTVAQSKRLIARAVAQHPSVQRARTAGIIAVGRGTTSGYIIEELLGQAIPKEAYVAGRTTPPGIRLGDGAFPDFVLERGARLADVTIGEIIGRMGPGDVFIKGGNALNYAVGVVGILVGHPTGGTIGATYGSIVSRKIELLLPIGLEKVIPEDIQELSRRSRRAEDKHPTAPATSLFPVTGTVITEIEAFAMLCGVEARQLAAGGVAGAEGAVWLLLVGTQEALDRALALHVGLRDEPNFGGSSAAS